MAALCASHKNHLHYGCPCLKKISDVPDTLKFNAILYNIWLSVSYLCINSLCLWTCEWLTTNTAWQCFKMSVDWLITRHTQKQKHAQYYQLKQYLLADKHWRFWCVMWACLPRRQESKYCSWFPCKVCQTWHVTYCPWAGCLHPPFPPGEIDLAVLYIKAVLQSTLCYIPLWCLT